MSDNYDFHYQPTGSGAISGQQVLQQTEDAINELGNYVNDNVGGAMDVAQQALETAQTAETNAQTALDTANSFSGAIQSAQQDASTALSAAQTAGTTAGNAYNLAVSASQDASNALTASGNAVSAVNTLSNTVTALGQQLTNDEQSISNNASAITGLTTRMGTAENNINTLNTNVGVAMGNASSAMATAGTVKQQSYVLRYSSASVTDNSTIAYSTLDNTDNIKSGDKVIDVDGKIFSVVSVDSVNSTVTVGTALIDLALDGNVVHVTGDENVGGIKNFTDDTYIKSLNFTNEVASTSSSSSAIMPLVTTVTYTDQTASKSARINLRITASGDKSLYPHENNQYALGLASRKWSEVHAITYYYGSSDVEFSQKFVTSDTAQDIAGNKNFKGLITTTPDSPLWAVSNNTTADITSLAINCVHIEHRVAGTLTDLSGGAWCVAQIGTGCFFFRYNTGTDIRYKHFNTNVVSKICVMSNDNKFISDLCPDTTDTYNLGDSTYKWATINGLEPSVLGMPDLSSGIDISSYITISQPGVEDVHTSTYTPTVNGFISVCLSRNGVCGVGIEQGDMRTYAREVPRTDLSARYAFAYLPVVKNVQVNIISCYADNIVSAKFFPCQGNV